MPKMLHYKPVRGGSPRRVFIAVPAYTDLCAEFVYALYATQDALHKKGIEVELAIFSGNCHVDDSRNRLVRDFLETDCTDFFFLDADLRWDADDFLAMLEYEEDVVGGSYPLKQEEERYPVKWLPGDIWTNEAGLVEVEAVPTGFLRIKRHVLESLAGVSSKYGAKDQRPDRALHPLIFERQLEGTVRWGGDYVFCRKWRAMGGKIFVAPDMRFFHIGNNSWGGSLQEYLIKENGLEENTIIEILQNIKAGTETIKEMLLLVKLYGNDWSAQADFLMMMVMLLRDNPQDVLECGSGLSTLILGSLGDELGFKVVTLEHDPTFADNTLSMLDKMGVKSVTVKKAPLKNKWYNYQPPKKFGMVVCDGPPRDDSDRSVVLKFKRLLGATILIDDADTEEKVVSESNAKMFGDKKKFAIGVINGNHSG